MKIFAIVALGIGIVCLLSPTHGKVVHYKMAIEENGKRYQERIDVDENEDIEVFRVPRHDDVEPADFYHDFKMGVTVTRLLSRQVCYISKLDPSLSSPKKLKADLDLVASWDEDIPTVTDSSLEMIIGPANRLLLTREILDFCGDLSIYNTEHTKVDLSRGNGTAIIRNQRRKRQIDMQMAKSCLSSAGRDPLEYVKRDNCVNANTIWNLLCKMKHYYSNCFHYVTCKSNTRKLFWTCNSVRRSTHIPICCDFVCP